MGCLKLCIIQKKIILRIHICVNLIFFIHTMFKHIDVYFASSAIMHETYPFMTSRTNSS